MLQRETERDFRIYFSEMADGLCCQLTFPAPRIAPTRPDLSHDTQQNWEIPRNQLQLKTKLGDGNFGEVGGVYFVLIGFDLLVLSFDTASWPVT